MERTKHYLYHTWNGMIQRCENPKNSNYPQYGGKGIVVCERWSSLNPKGFENFIEDMGNRPKGTTLDRIDTYSGYSKNNCRWATKRTQQNNRRTNRNNTSGVSGVQWSKNPSCWVANIFLNGKNIVIGRYSNLNTAEKKYRRALEIKQNYTDNLAFLWINRQTVKTPVGKRINCNKTSNYYGVSWDKSRKKWKAQVHNKIGNKLVAIFLGRFDLEDNARDAVINYLEGK